jgi:L-amino acid N-acyltransferase YncA
MIRTAEEQDAGDIARIYNQAMKPGIYATCDVTPVSRESRIEWLAHHHDPYPAWVYESETGQVVGWCSLSPFSVRPTMPGIAETSTYVDETYRFRRIGRDLLMHLIAEGRRLGHKSLVSLVFEKNVASISTRLRFGFRPNAMLYDVAHMRGSWENVVWLQKDLLEEESIWTVKDDRRRAIA